MVKRMSGVGIMGVGIPNAFNPPESDLKVGAKPRFWKNSLLGRAKLRCLQKQILPYRGFKGVFPNFYWKNFLRLLQIRCKLAYLCRAFLESRSDPVAQSVEHLTFNQGVMGSSPIGITDAKANELFFNLLAFFVFCLITEFGVEVLSCTHLWGYLTTSDDRNAADRNIVRTKV